MELDYISIGKRLKELRGEVSQTKFGEQLGYGYGYVRNCEHGKKPSLEYLTKIVTQFSVTMDWLLFGKDPIGYIPLKEQKKEVVLDLDLQMMIDILKDLMESGDPDLRGWAKIQFKSAFKELCASHEDEKKHA